MINFGLSRNHCVSHGSLQWSVPSQIGHLIYIFATCIDPGFPTRIGNFLIILNFDKLTQFSALPTRRMTECKYFRL